MKWIGRCLIRYADKRVYVLSLSICKYHGTVCEICINRSCSKADILLRRTDTFGPVCFINAFLSPISKVTCLTPTRIKLDIFVNFLKENIFLHFKTIIFLISYFSSSAILSSRTLYLFFQVALCNQPKVVLCHWKWYQTGTFKPYITPLWTIDFSIVTYIKFWWSVKDFYKNALKTRSTVNVLTSDKSLAFFIYLLCFPSFNCQSK